jgi:serine acetyltransferase
MTTIETATGLKGRAPTIGNDVFIGPNAVLIGLIAVGNEAFICPGAVCAIDVPARHAPAGVRAHVGPHNFSPLRLERGSTGSNARFHCRTAIGAGE